MTAGFFGQTLAIALEEIWGLAPPTWSLTPVSSVLILVTTLFGFKAIDRLALFGAFADMFLIYVASLHDRRQPPAVLNIRGANPDYFYTAVSTVVGSLIVGVVRCLTCQGTPAPQTVFPPRCWAMVWAISFPCSWECSPP